MKRETGWVTALVAVATAAIGFSTISPKQDSPTSTSVRAQPATDAPKKLSLYGGPCSELREVITTFFTAPEGAISGPASCVTPEMESAQKSTKSAQKGTRPAKKSNKRAAKNHLGDVRFVIATLPDPVHTHLPLMFDRHTEAIEQAAQDEGYTYDSSWLPWERETSEHPLVSDQDLAERRKQEREDQPGIVLFRKSFPEVPGKEKASESPYRHALIVFVVGEDATDGIHRAQFKNATRWIGKFRAEGSGFATNSVQILGPSFSGGLPSLDALLEDDESAKALNPDENKALEIFSGSVTSHRGALWFRNRVSESILKPPETALPAPLRSKILFRSFQQDEEVTRDRYSKYLAEVSGHSGKECKLASVSEDETAFGNLGTGVSPPPANAKSFDTKCSWTNFYYPRDISAVRTAYQEQSLFSPGSAGPALDSGRRTLRADLADPEVKNRDTIRGYGGNQTALSEEAVLLQIVNMMQVHGIEFILVRSSNPLDQLFLAHFFKLTYPEGRVIIMSSDLLLRRDVGSGGLNGIMTLITYPLLPDLDHWTSTGGGAPEYPGHSHLAFAQNSAQAVYTALRFLLTRRQASWRLAGAHDSCLSSTEIDCYFLPLDEDPALKLPGYSSPFWLSPMSRPVTWLAVLGNDSFWPVASFDGEQVRDCRSWLEIVAGSLPGFGTPPPRPPPLAYYRPVPLSMNIALLAVLVWSVFHAICCCRPSVTVKPDHRSYFVRMKSQTDAVHVHMKSNKTLIVFSSALIVMICTILAWSYGWMSDHPAPIRYGTYYNAMPEVVWALGALAVLGNVLVEHHLEGGRAGKAAWRVVWKPLVAFVGLTAGFYLFFLLALDGALPPQVKTPTYLRAMNLTTGVSPVVPLVLLALGMYAWCWYSLRGLALLGPDRPRLPCRERLKLKAGGTGKKQDFLSMLSDQVAKKLEPLCEPFHRRTWGTVVLCLIALCAAGRVMADGVPIRALGIWMFSLTISIWIALNMSILLANAWQLLRLWLRLRSLLVFLDKLPLRRTLRAMRGVTWGSIWKMGGDVLDIRYKVYYREFETLNHLEVALGAARRLYRGTPVPTGEVDWAKVLEEGRNVRTEFSSWYSRHWDEWRARDLSKLQAVQESAAAIAGDILVDILIPAWRVEEHSLLIPIMEAKDEKESEDARSLRLVAGLPPAVRHGEEAVCLLYLGFVQNILGRMRSLMMGMVFLFLSIALVVPSYPFDPRPVLTGVVVCLFSVVLVVVFIVYSQMFRDATLSNLTNTNPGELGGEFWLKFLSFGVGPVIGLLATVFPGVSDFVASWLQPSLSSVK